MAKKARKPEPQTPSLALNTSTAKAPLAARRPSAEPLTAAEAATSPAASGLKATEEGVPALPEAGTLAREIYRLALEQKDGATLVLQLQMADWHGKRLSFPRKGAGKCGFFACFALGCADFCPKNHDLQL